MPWFGRNKAEELAEGPPRDPRWTRTPGGNFHRMVHLDPEDEGLAGRSGVFVIWHGGVRPRWVYVGRSNDLAADLHGFGNNRDVMDYEVHGGLFVTWSLIRTEFQDGVVAFLTDTLDPAVENPEVPGEDVLPIPVVPPGATPDGG